MHPDFFMYEFKNWGCDLSAHQSSSVRAVRYLVTS